MGMERRSSRWAAFTVSVVLACVGCGERGPQLGYEMATLDLVPITPDARPVSAADLKGKVTLINFWATWCGPCVQEFPHLLRIADGFHDQKDFQFLSVSTGYPTVDQIREETDAFLKTRGFRLPVYADVRERTKRGIAGVPDVIPITVLVDRGGKIAKVVVGFNSAELDQMHLQIASLLQAAK